MGLPGSQSRTPSQTSALVAHPGSPPQTLSPTPTLDPSPGLQPQPPSWILPHGQEGPGLCAPPPHPVSPCLTGSPHPKLQPDPRLPPQEVLFTNTKEMPLGPVLETHGRTLGAVSTGDPGPEGRFLH